MQKYDKFINEKVDLDKSKDIHKKLMEYLIDRINKETENLPGDSININANEYDYDDDNLGITKWLYCNFYSDKLSCDPVNDSIDDHIQLVEDSLKGLKALESIIEDIQENFNVVIFNQIKKAGKNGVLRIITNIEIAYIHNNNKLENFLMSNRGINRYKL